MPKRFLFGLLVLIGLLFLFSIKKPTQVMKDAGVWALEMDFQFTKIDNVVMKLCNPTESAISFVDDVYYGVPEYALSYEIKGKSIFSTMKDASVPNLGSIDMPKPGGSGASKKMSNLQSGECKTYNRTAHSVLGAYYESQRREARSIKQEGDENIKSYLTQDEIDSLLPEAFRVHVTIMDGASKTKGVTFISEWFDIKDHAPYLRVEAVPMISVKQ